MIIKKLALHNFGVYASDNVFVFNKKKPVVLIGGMNGRGKTTFLEAILLALYGANSFAVSESSHKSYGQYLRVHVNTADGTLESYVELEFDMNTDEDMNTYTVKRSWTSKAKRMTDSVQVMKNGKEDSFLSKNWAMFVESVLPSGLANFFFFDGEKIAELASGETNEAMKSAIKSLLGINVIDSLSSDLQRIMNRLDSEHVQNYDAVHVEELRGERDDKKAALDGIVEQITNLEDHLADLKNKLSRKEAEFHAKGGDIIDEAPNLYSERATLNGKLSHINEELVEFAGSELPLELVRPLLNDILVQSKREQEDKNTRLAVDKIGEFIRLYSKSEKKSKALDSFADFVKKAADSQRTPSVYDLSDMAYHQCLSLVSHQLGDIRSKYEADKNTLITAQKRVDEIDNYLSVDIDEKTIQKIYKTILQLRAQIAETEVQIESLQKEKTAANGEYLRASTEFNRCVSNYLSVMERDDDVQRMRKYALYAQQIAKQYQLALQKEKIDSLAKTMTERYKRLLDKKNLIDRIEMDAETLDYYCLDKDGNVIPKSSLSAGEKQLMVVSMLWALAICSKKKLPVIIDTPLARLDSKHRKALITKYFPNASEQTIILSTDSEIDSTYYNIIKKFVSNEFTLRYDEDAKSSTIEQGYFKEEIADDN